MKKIFQILLILLVAVNLNPEACFSDEIASANKTIITDTDDLEEIYRRLEVPTFKYVHDVDPDESFDTQRLTWSPYPLLKLGSTIYFKSVVIPPGYYLLTPREQDGGLYLLFKDAGKVRYIVPIYKKEIVPRNFYEENLEKPKLTISQVIHVKTLDFVGKHFKSSMRKPEPKSYLEMSDLSNNFVSIILYWGDYKYYIVVRTTQL